jgi:hypothetical protein
MLPKLSSRPKKSEQTPVTIAFEEAHLYTLIAALDTYSRLQSGQIGMALDIVYADRDLSYEEREDLERRVRAVAFPKDPALTYDGHGGYTDQYHNSYGEDGALQEESPEWKAAKNRPKLNHPNSSFGVGCPEMKGGTIAFEIRKVLEEFLHYKRYEGRRNPMDVSGDGMPFSYSGIKPPQILNWSPTATFKIPKRYHKKVDALIEKKAWPDLWNLVERAFSKNPLPRGESSQILRQGEGWVVEVKKPTINKISTL